MSNFADKQMIAYAAIHRLCNKETTSGLIQQDIDRLVKIYLDELVEASKEMGRMYAVKDMEPMIIESFNAGYEGRDQHMDIYSAKEYAKKYIKRTCYET